MTDPPAADVPTARLVRRPRFNPAWLAPIAVLIVVAIVAWQGYAERGPRISIRFDDASGLRVGDSLVYRGVQVGRVERIDLHPSEPAVTVLAELRANAQRLATKGAQFWIVRPEVSLERIAGLDTLVGPHYIQVRPGPTEAPPARAFTALASVPSSQPEIPEGARLVNLRAARLGPVSVGTPITFRDIPVGRVYHAHLAPDADAVLIAAAIDPEYAPLLRTRTRFWNASGISADFGLFAGLSVRADSLQSVLTGAIAFATPDRAGDEIQDNHVFELETDAPDSWARWDPEISLPPARPRSDP